MSKARKSSIDGTRRPLKAHIPYRADDFTHGKKTGVNVREVDRRSDGFEKFDDVLNQADAITPPHRRGRRGNNRSLTPPDEEEDDENGVIDMDIDDTMTTNFGLESPDVYFNNAPRPSAPTSANRSAATGLNSNRSSYIDFDRIPSPRPSSSSQRARSQANGSSTMTTTPRTKSNLSHQTVVPSSPEDDESDNEPLHDAGGGDELGYDFDGGNDDFANDQPAPESSSPVAARTSFTEIAQDDTDPPQVDDIRISSPPQKIEKKKKNGKQKESVAEHQLTLVEDFTQGLAEVDEESVEEEAPVSKQKTKSQKKRRLDDDPRPKEKKQPVKRYKVQADLESGHEMRDGIRRGTRSRFKPLEWWRCEKVVYGRRDNGISMIPVIKEVIRIPKEVTNSLAHKGHRRSKPRSRSKTVQDAEEVVVFNPEEGWDDQTDPHGVVLDFQSGQEVQRRLAFTSKMMTPRPAANNDFLYQKIFGDGEFIAAGQLILPVGGKKPSKGTKDNTYIFYLIEGAINLKVHRTSFVLATGGMFLIPRGNTYYLENISQRPAKLFFAQARKVSAEDEPPQEVVHAHLPSRTKSVDPAGPRHPSGKSGSLARSSSVAATGSTDKLIPADKKATKRAVSK